VKLFKYQQWHVISLLILLFGIYFISKHDTSVLAGELFGMQTWHWFILAILSPIIHQIYVVLVWRSELYYNQFSNWFGDDGFTVFKIGFALLFVSRPITILLLSISNAKTVHINPIFSYVLSGILLIPAIYLFYSVKTYFGIDKAFGLDHFNPEAFKKEPLIKKGIFKYASNAMYIFGFFILWIPGIILQSKAALLVALFSHIYIWVHYYVTELPDMKVIYGEN